MIRAKLDGDKLKREKEEAEEEDHPEDHYHSEPHNSVLPS